MPDRKPSEFEKYVYATGSDIAEVLWLEGKTPEEVTDFLKRVDTMRQLRQEGVISEIIHTAE